MYYFSGFNIFFMLFVKFLIPCFIFLFAPGIYVLKYLAIVNFIFLCKLYVINI